MYGVDFLPSFVASYDTCSGHPVPKLLSLVTRGCTAVLFHGKYIILCASCGQRDLNGSVLLLVMVYLT